LITEYDAKKLLKAFKKVCVLDVETVFSSLNLFGLQEFACNGTLVDDEEMGQVIQLQGDQRTKISTFLVENGIPRASIKLHGF
jgi:translation initiation factor 1